MDLIIKMEKDLFKDFSISGKSESFEKMLSILKFIGKVREGERIDVGTMSIVKPVLSDRLYRTFISRETREQTLNFLKTSVNKAIEMLYYYLSFDKDEEFHHRVVQVLIANLEIAKRGIKNLMRTYEDQAKFVTDLETLVETMEMKVTNEKKEEKKVDKIINEFAPQD